MRLVNELFVNEIPELQHGGKLRPVMFISAAWIIGSYNELVRDVTTGNIIFIKVMAQKNRLTLTMPVFPKHLNRGGMLLWRLGLRKTRMPFAIIIPIGYHKMHH